MFENVQINWSKGRLMSHLIKLFVLMAIDPSDGSVELELQDTMEVLNHRFDIVAN